MRIGVVKPHWGVAGGFERLLDRLIEQLKDAGHVVETVPFPALITPRPIWGESAGVHQWKHHPEFFRYMALTEDVLRLDLQRFDLAISTQPPTFLANHPKVLGLFYHQARIFYDLADLYRQLNEVDPAHHDKAVSVVRSVDRARLGNVRHWLAGSEECGSRLGEYWDVPDRNISFLQAPPLTVPPETPPPWRSGGSVLCVSRHEWPKRTELLLAAAHLLPAGQKVELVGGGGRLKFLRQLDQQLIADPALAASQDPQQLWMQSALSAKAPKSAPAGSPVILHGAVSDDERDAAYARASVVVAPAYREDYGLTALEAMLWQRPVIVCEDGGGLVDIVRDTGAGLVVPPTPQGIADGIERIRDDSDLASELLANAAAVPSTYTWERCGSQLLNAVDQASG